MKKRDLIIIAGVVAVALIAFGVFHLINKKGTGLMLRVSQNGAVIRTLPLDHDDSETITSDLGSNTIVIKDHSARVESANCDNQVCAQPGDPVPWRNHCLPASSADTRNHTGALKWKTEHTA